MLLDTCALIWLATGSDRLSQETRARMASSPSLYVCAITAFEIAVAAGRGRLTLAKPAWEWYSRALLVHDLTEIPVDGWIASRAALLPPIHKDPCDRMIVVAAQTHGLTIVTGDERLGQYGVEWVC